jgi:FkbM family methyltransferase
MMSMSSASSISDSESSLEQLQALLSEPLESVRERERTAFDHLATACENRIVLCGAGNLGRRTLACLRNSRIEPLAFCDNSSQKWGRVIDGLKILSPADAGARYGDSALFVVTIWSRGHWFRETQARLVSHGVRRVVAAELLRWKFAESMLPDLCLDLPHKLFAHAQDILAAAQLWADPASQAEYLRQIRWRAWGDRSLLNEASKEESYFPDSIFSPLPDEVFIDCGAYDGDTVRRILERQGNLFRRVDCFEPDPLNFARLQAWAVTLAPGISAKIRILDRAVGAERSVLNFNADGTEGAGIARNREDGIRVQCVRLDDVLAESDPPTHIKMDIEGAERDALQGASQLIRRHRPVLSVCLYHAQNDIWRIPLLIRALSGDYCLFLRSHDPEGCQLVAYAVPPQRLSGRAAGPRS